MLLAWRNYDIFLNKLKENGIIEDYSSVYNENEDKEISVYSTFYTLVIMLYSIIYYNY